MLETEQEETKERERVKLKKKEDERLKKYEQQLNEWLFGVTGWTSRMHSQTRVLNSVQFIFTDSLDISFSSTLRVILLYPSMEPNTDPNPSN